MERKSFLCLLSFFVFLCCKKNNLNLEFKVKENNHTSSFKIDEDKISYIALKSDSINGLFTDIGVIDSLLICGNLRTSKLINVYSLNRKKIIKELIPRGELKNEGLSAASIYTNKSSVWIYDITSSKLFKININSSKQDTLITKQINLPRFLKNIISPTIINDSIILATTYSMDDFRYLYASQQKIIKRVGKLPDVSDSDYLIDRPNTKFPNKASIFKAGSIKHPFDNKVAILYNKANRIEFYSNDNLINVVEGQDNFSPIMQVTKLEEGGFSVEDCDETKYAYLSIANTEKYIYGLYSGNNEISSNKILVFDWNGRFRQALYLDRKIFKISIDSTGKILYCYGDKGNEIYSTNLNINL